MKRLLKLGIPLGLIAILLIAGCVSLPSEKIVITRYSIDPVLDSIPNGVSLPASIYIMPFTAAADQKSDRINYRVEENEMNRFYYHRWSAAPQKLIADIMSDFLVETNLFEEGVFQEAVGVVPEYELHGKLLQLFSNDVKRNPSAVFEVRITIFRVEPEPYRKYKVFQEQYRYDELRKNARVTSFVEASNLVAGKWLNDLYRDLSATLGPDQHVQPKAAQIIPAPDPTRTRKPEQPLESLDEGGEENRTTEQ